MTDVLRQSCEVPPLPRPDWEIALCQVNYTEKTSVVWLKNLHSKSILQPPYWFNPWRAPSPQLTLLILLLESLKSPSNVVATKKDSRSPLLLTNASLKQLLQEELLQLPESLSFPTPRTLPVEPAPVLPSPKSWAPLINGIILVSKDKWSDLDRWRVSLFLDRCGWLHCSPKHTALDQFRPVYVSAAQKGCNFRGLDTRLLFSQVMIWLVSKMLLCVSLVANLRDPTDGTKVTSNVVKSHAR